MTCKSFSLPIIAECYKHDKSVYLSFYPTEPILIDIMILNTFFFQLFFTMRKLSRQQLIIFSSVYVAYTLYVYVRRSFSYTIPILVTEGRLDKKQLGTVHITCSLHVV